MLLELRGQCHSSGQVHADGRCEDGQGHGQSTPSGAGARRVVASTLDSQAFPREPQTRARPALPGSASARQPSPSSLRSRALQPRRPRRHAAAEGPRKHSELQPRAIQGGVQGLPRWPLCWEGREKAEPCRFLPPTQPTVGAPARRQGPQTRGLPQRDLDPWGHSETPGPLWLSRRGRKRGHLTPRCHCESERRSLQAVGPGHAGAFTLIRFPLPQQLLPGCIAVLPPSGPPGVSSRGGSCGFRVQLWGHFLRLPRLQPASQTPHPPSHFNPRPCVHRSLRAVRVGSISRVLEA